MRGTDPTNSKWVCLKIENLQFVSSIEIKNYSLFKFVFKYSVIILYLIICNLYDYIT